MYKNTIFDPVNLSLIGENAPLVEEKKIDFSLDSFKSNVLFHTYYIHVYTYVAHIHCQREIIGQKDVKSMSSIIFNWKIHKKKIKNNNLLNILAFTLVEYVDATWVKYMWWVYLIGLIWISEFIVGCQGMVISGSVAHWYFR